jgi:hypothetical protein
MIAELDLLSDPWTNFCSRMCGGDTRYLTVKSVNRELKKYNAYCKDLGEWRVFFANQQALSFFVLKWS